MTASRTKFVDTAVLMSVCRAVVALGTLPCGGLRGGNCIVEVTGLRWYRASVLYRPLCCMVYVLYCVACLLCGAGEAFVIWSAAHPGNHVVSARTLASLIPLLLQFSYANIGSRCRAEVRCDVDATDTAASRVCCFCDKSVYVVL